MHLQIDVGGGYQLEEQALPVNEQLQQAESQSPTAAANGKPVPVAVEPLAAGQKRKRVSIPSSNAEDQDSDAEEVDESADGTDEVDKHHLSALRQVQSGVGLQLKAGKVQLPLGMQDSSIGTNQVEQDDSSEDDDLLVVKRRDVLSTGGAGKDAAEGVPLGAVELRGNKKKKKLRIDPGRTSGARTVFDEEGESLQPLALLAKEQLDRSAWVTNLLHKQ